ncbi:AEC family transporter [Marinomonas spartinae]|uniref:AEC family transporter n=1 Tax=Marinomonas spartinae TaxID=1792290 RepID=UPI0018F19E38|nr:AEC family transporter [Marinomonas spartinae]MBJ7552811.1 AEC family transporter [Marinomonas spartinae]
MLSLSVSIVPIFLLLMIGALCQRWRFPADGFWSGVDKLAYWVLFPALLFSNTSTMDFSNPLLFRYGLILLLAMAGTAVFVFACAFMLKVKAPVTSSMLQAGVRFNTFLTLALASSLYGTQGLTLAVLGASVLIPSINVFVVVSMVLLHGKSAALQRGKAAPSLSQLVINALIRNPLIVSIVLGAGLNLAGLTPIPLVSDTVSILAKAALPMVLLAVGASVRFEVIRSVGMTFVWSAVARFVVFTGLVALSCWWLDITGVPALVAILFGVVPTAASGYALARQLGGDSERMAAFITLQTLLCVVTLPVSVLLSQHIFG